MADYAITGKKGAGKGLFSTGLIRDALRDGKRVASNMDIHLDALFQPLNKSTYTRIPDRPTIDDFIAIGRGQDGILEDDNGIIVLDEVSTFFGSRQFGDKSRQPMLDWLVHSRKYGWDVYYVMQGLAQADKQIRDTQIEYHIAVNRTDKWPIPIITPLARTVGIKVTFPKMHFGVIKHGVHLNALFIERRWYRGSDLYAGYDTQQIFLDREHPQACGIHTKLSSWYLKGRYLGWFAVRKPILITGITLGLLLGIPAGGYMGYLIGKPRPTVDQQIDIDDSVKATGYINDAGRMTVYLSDGRALPSTAYKNDGIEYFLIGSKWIASQK